MGQDFFKQTLQYFIYFKSAASLSLYWEDPEQVPVQEDPEQVPVQEDPEQVPVQEDPEQVSVQDQAGNHVF